MSPNWSVWGLGRGDLFSTMSFISLARRLTPCLLRCLLSYRCRWLMAGCCARMTFGTELIIAASSVLMVWMVSLGTSFLGNRDDSIILLAGNFCCAVLASWVSCSAICCRWSTRLFVPVCMMILVGLVKCGSLITAVTCSIVAQLIL